jgi:hypothetical protein
MCTSGHENSLSSYFMLPSYFAKTFLPSFCLNKSCIISACWHKFNIKIWLQFRLQVIVVLLQSFILLGFQIFGDVVSIRVAYSDGLSVLPLKS